MTSNVIDQPAKANEDRLNMKAYASALTEFIANAQSPLTIALQGEWGSGKTSLMNVLRAKLAGTDEKGKPDRSASFLGVWINTWQYALMSDPEEAIRNILLGIIGQVSTEANTTDEERKTLFRKIARVGGSVFSDVFKKYSGVDAEKIVKELSAGETVPDKSSVENLKDELSMLVAKALENNKGKKRGFIFFIDDLDRIDPPVAVQILELLKNIFDLEKCIFVLAIDYGVVVKGLKPKFGAMTPENEREFRSFFDKIIQLPFSMPVSSYKIDDFLMASLREIGYIDEKEERDETLCEAITDYALQSVGTNPRSLKRLINYLSLIKLIIAETNDKQDDADFAAWKDILFALVSLQIQYPKVYEALQGDPDFPNWGEAFEQKWRIPALAQEEKEKLGRMVEFDEPWEQMLFRFCRRDAFLEARALNISRAMNRIRARITADNPTENVGETVEWLLRLSAVTSVKSEQSQIEVIENFSKSQFLRDLRDFTFGMEWPDKCWQASLGTDASITSTQTRFQSNFACCIWKSGIKGIKDKINYLGPLTIHPFHDGKSFQLKIWGEFWGNGPGKNFRIDFMDDKIQSTLVAAESDYCDAWSPFGVAAKIGQNIGHHAENIWWNITVPFKDHDELVSDEFSEKLCGSLAKVAAAFASLTPYRVSVNNNK